MSTLADFALLAAVPSYGGAEILRAQRVLPMGPGPRVHLALFGRNERVMHRVVAAANAGAAILHPAIARIYEVARYDGVVYGVADPSEGLDLSALVATRRPVPMEVGLAVTASIARVAVAIHDAGGPGYRGPPLGLGAVLAGGLDPAGVFLEPNGAVRLRPLAAAGADPDQPSGFRAPEGAVSMAADVYSLGRLLMALLSGDPTGQTVPRVPSSSSSLSALMSRLVHARASERPHLHEVVTRLESLLREQNVGGPDRIVRAALLGPYRSMVMDPGLGLDAAPRVVDTLRMQLAFIYPAVERLWPTMTPSVMLPPPPPAQAALPPAMGDDDVGVFTDARPAVRRQRAKTAATLMIGAADVAAAFAAESGEGNAFKPRTSPTLLIPTAELLKALPAAGVAPVAAGPVERTMLIEPATFSPFSPFSPPPPPPPPPATRSTLTPPPPTPPPSRKAHHATPPPSPRPALGMVANQVAVVVDTGDSDDRTQMLPPEAGDLMARLAASERQNALAEAADFAQDWSVNDDEQGDVFSDDDGSGFANSLRASTSSTAPTGVSPAPVMSEHGGPHAMANAPTAMGKARVDDNDEPAPRTNSGTPGFGVSGNKLALEDAFDDAFSSPPNSPAPATHAPAMTLSYDEGATATRRGVSDSSALDVIDDGADFVMVGDGGQTYAGDDNPFGASTRLYPAQAMQVARPTHDEEHDDRSIDGDAVIVVDDPDELDDPDRQSDVFSREQSLELRRGVVPRWTTEGDNVRTELVNVAQLEAAMRNRDADERPMATAAPAAAVSAEGVALGQGMGANVPPASAVPPERSRPVPVAGRPSPASPAASGRGSVPDGAPMSQLLVDAPEGATVTLNGTIIGTGRTNIDVAADFRAVVKVTMQGHAPFSTVVSVQGRPRVRVTPVLKTR